MSEQSPKAAPLHTRLTAAVALSAVALGPMSPSGSIASAETPGTSNPPIETLYHNYDMPRMIMPESSSPEPVAESSSNSSANKPTAGNQEPAINRTPNLKNSPGSEYMNLQPEKLHIPQLVADTMSLDTVYIPELGCSGFMVRNDQGKAIGIETAQHCGLLYSDGHWGNDSEDQTTVTFGAPVIVYTGSGAKNLKEVGQIDHFVLSNPTDKTHDQVVGSFEGEDPMAVLAAYKDRHLTAEQIGELKMGDIIYTSGWPQYQPKNPGAEARQQFAMRVLGLTNWYVSDGLQLELLVAAVPPNNDGSECSWGWSGSEAFVMRTITMPDGSTQHVPYSIGTASAFSDFGRLFNNKSNGQTEKQSIEHSFGADMTGFAAVCGLAIESPSPEAGMEIARVEVLPYSEILQQESTFTSEFFTDTYERNVIEGLVYIQQYGSPYWITNPAYTYDAATNSLVLAYACPTDKGGPGDEGGLCTMQLTGSAINQDILVYGTDTQTSPNITTTSTGPLTAITNAESQMSYTDQSGLSIGLYNSQYNEMEIPPTVGDASLLSIVKGQLTLSPIPPGQAGGKDMPIPK